MRTDLRTLRSIIRSILNETKEKPIQRWDGRPLTPPPTPPWETPKYWAREKGIKSSSGAPLGWIAFSPERKNFGFNKGMPQEPNTGVEEELRTAIVDFINGDLDVKSELVALLKSILRLGLYEDVFRYTPAHLQTLYRGIMLTEERVLNSPPGLRNVLLNLTPNTGAKTVSFPWQLEPNNKTGLSSWSEDFKVAQKFAMDNLYWDEKAFAIVMHADLSENSKNFMDMLNILKQLNSRPDMWHEKEHLGLGNIKISRMTVLRVDPDKASATEITKLSNWPNIT